MGAVMGTDCRTMRTQRPHGCGASCDCPRKQYAAEFAAWDAVSDVSRLLNAGHLQLRDIPGELWDSVCALRYAAQDAREEVVGAQTALLMAQNPRMSADAARNRAASLVPLVAV